MRIGAIWCNTNGGKSVVEEGGDLLGGKAGEGTEFGEGDEVMGFFLITVTDTCQEMATVTVALAGDALDVFWVDDDSCGFHGWLT